MEFPVNDTQDFLKFFVSDIALHMVLTLHLVRKKFYAVRGGVTILFEIGVEVTQIQENIVERIQLHLRGGFQNVLLHILYGYGCKREVAQRFTIMKIMLHYPSHIITSIFPVVTFCNKGINQMLILWTEGVA